MTTKKILPRALFVLVISSVLIFESSCQRHTELLIENGKPLRFVLSGPGTLENVQISGPDLEREPHRRGDGERLPLLRVYWELAPKEGVERHMNQVGSITYGTVPDGFVQVQPASNELPPSLVDRDLYNIRISVKDAAGINRFFVIRDGRIDEEREP